MDNTFKEIVWNQFGASIDMLDNAITACPDEIWGNKMEPTEFWYLTFHTLFWLDYYLSDPAQEFIPPTPFTLSELDPAGLLPDRVYSKSELKNYLDHGRRKCRTVINDMSDQKSRQLLKFGWIELNSAEFLLYNMRHVQHHAAQLNFILRQKIDSAPSWVRQAGSQI